MPDDHRRPRLPWPRSGLVPAGKVGRGHLHRPIRPQPDRHHPGVDPGRGNGERHRPPFPDPPNRSAGRSRLPVTRSSGDPLAPNQGQAPGQHGNRPHDPPASPPWPADRGRREPDPPPAGPAAQGARHPDPHPDPHLDPRHPDPPLSGPPVGDATPTGHRGAQGCPQPPAGGTGAHVRPRPPAGVWVRAAVHIPLRSERRRLEVTGRSRCPSGGGGRSRPPGRRGRGRRR
jgi:hypothetical protein